MSLYHLTGSLLTLIAVFGYLNHKVLKLPNAIGIAAVGLLLSLTATLFGLHDPKWVMWAENLVHRIDFSEVMLHGLLGLLLFAGALSTNVTALTKQWLPVLILATVGVALSTLVTGVALWVLLGALDMHLRLVYCLMFGALISPTDPVAVLAALKQHALPERLQSTIVGESLFNDGTGVAVFIILLGLASGSHAVTASWAIQLLLTEVLGGLVVGGLLGGAVLLMLKTIDNYQVEILITLALATAGYAAAEALGTSAPIAMVMAGLMIGSLGPRYAMSNKSQEALFSFWELVDELLNLLLFGLIGVLVLSLDFTTQHLWVAVVAVPVVLFGRWISVLLPSMILRPLKGPNIHRVTLMTWGGLRGGVSIALALSLPAFPYRDYVVAATYGVVVFSLLVQALSLGKLLSWLSKRNHLDC